MTRGRGGGLRVFHDEVLNNPHSSPVIKGIKSGRMRWAGHVAGLLETRNA